MVQRVVRALASAGGVLIVLGLAYGLWQVGDGCGSAFSPDDLTTLRGNQLSCAGALAGRVNQAWFFVILGIGLLTAAVGLNSGSQPAVQAAAAPVEGDAPVK